MPQKLNGRGEMVRVDGSKYGKVLASKGHSSIKTDVLNIPAEYWRDAVLAVLLAGDAVLLGTTRDGGAVVMTIMEGDRRHRQYFSDATELMASLQELGKSVEGL